MQQTMGLNIYIGAIIMLVISALYTSLGLYNIIGSTNTQSMIGCNEEKKVQSYQTVNF